MNQPITVASEAINETPTDADEGIQTLTMIYKKHCKHSIVFEANPFDNPWIRSVYVANDAFGGDAAAKRISTGHRIHITLTTQ